MVLLKDLRVLVFLCSLFRDSYAHNRVSSSCSLYAPHANIRYFLMMLYYLVVDS